MGNLSSTQQDNKKNNINIFMPTNINDGLYNDIKYIYNKLLIFFKEKENTKIEINENPIIIIDNSEIKNNIAIVFDLLNDIICTNDISLIKKLNNNKIIYTIKFNISQLKLEHLGSDFFTLLIISCLMKGDSDDKNFYQYKNNNHDYIINSLYEFQKQTINFKAFVKIDFDIQLNSLLSYPDFTIKIIYLNKVIRTLYFKDITINSEKICIDNYYEFPSLLYLYKLCHEYRNGKPSKDNLCIRMLNLLDKYKLIKYKNNKSIVQIYEKNDMSRTYREYYIINQNSNEFSIIDDIGIKTLSDIELQNIHFVISNNNDLNIYIKAIEKIFLSKLCKNKKFDIYLQSEKLKNMFIEKIKLYDVEYNIKEINTINMEKRRIYYKFIFDFLNEEFTDIKKEYKLKKIKENKECTIDNDTNINSNNSDDDVISPLISRKYKKN
jgi:hypothetical protein